MGLKERITENSQIDLKWLSEETKELKETIIYFEGLQEREAYRPDADRVTTAEIIKTLKTNLNTVQEEYGRRIKDKEPK